MDLLVEEIDVTVDIGNDEDPTFEKVYRNCNEHWQSTIGGTNDINDD